MSEESKSKETRAMYRVVARVVHQEGYCFAGHKVGDEFDMGVGPGTGFVPTGMCNWAHSTIFPFTTVLWFGGTFPWVKDPDTHEERVACPDGTNPDGKAKIIFALRREKVPPEAVTGSEG